jgi:hypothetical protein
MMFNTKILKFVIIQNASVLRSYYENQHRPHL